MGGVITGTAFTDQFPSINTTTANGNSTLQGFTVAIYNIGCWAGALLTMFIGDGLGRKRTIVVGATVLAVGTVIQCSAFSLAQLLVCFFFLFLFPSVMLMGLCRLAGLLPERAMGSLRARFRCGMLS